VQLSTLLHLYAAIGKCVFTGECNTWILENSWRENRICTWTVPAGCDWYWWPWHAGHPWEHPSKVSRLSGHPSTHSYIHCTASQYSVHAKHGMGFYAIWCWRSVLDVDGRFYFHLCWSVRIVQVVWNAMFIFHFATAHVRINITGWSQLNCVFGFVFVIVTS
jgi:hypothetical protein